MSLDEESALTQEEQSKLSPFIWVDHDTSVSVIFSVDGAYKQEVFDTRRDEGFEGNGYDWASLASVYLAEKQSDLVGKVSMDPEAGMFCAYTSDKEALKKFAFGFRALCDDVPLMKNLFSRAELD